MKIEVLENHFTCKIKMTEEEVRIIVGTFEDLLMWQDRPAFKGKRGPIYDTLTQLLNNKKTNKKQNK